jgi:hypothetical protein
MKGRVDKSMGIVTLIAEALTKENVRSHRTRDQTEVLTATVMTKTTGSGKSA